MVFISTNKQQDPGILTDHRGFSQPTTELIEFYGIYGWLTIGYLCNIIGYDGIYIYIMGVWLQVGARPQWRPC